MGDSRLQRARKMDCPVPSQPWVQCSSLPRPQHPQRTVICLGAEAINQACSLRGTRSWDSLEALAQSGPFLLCLLSWDPRNALFMALLGEQWWTAAPGWAPQALLQMACPCASPALLAGVPPHWDWVGGPHSAGRGAPQRKPVSLSVDEQLL